MFSAKNVPLAYGWHREVWTLCVLWLFLLWILYVFIAYKYLNFQKGLSILGYCNFRHATCFLMGMVFQKEVNTCSLKTWSFQGGASGLLKITSDVWNCGWLIFKHIHNFMNLSLYFDISVNIHIHRVKCSVDSFFLSSCSFNFLISQSEEKRWQRHSNLLVKFWTCIS